ncbi:hypothetical protein TUM17576_18300 [Enterobacter hormaechei]|nr:hypothetical protein TUM17576_18300 [Enterobacter hormaechei]
MGHGYRSKGEGKAIYIKLYNVGECKRLSEKNALIARRWLLGFEQLQQRFYLLIQRHQVFFDDQMQRRGAARTVA